MKQLIRYVCLFSVCSVWIACDDDTSSGWFWIDQDEKEIGPLLLAEPAHMDSDRVLWRVDEQSGSIALPVLEKVYLEDDCGGEEAADAAGLFDAPVTGQRTTFHVAFRTAGDNVIRIPSDMSDVAITSTIESRLTADGCVDVDPGADVTRLLLVDTTTASSVPDVQFQPPFHTRWVGIVP